MNELKGKLGDYNVVVNEVGFGKPLGNSIICSATIGDDQVLELFSEYYDDFIRKEREAFEDGEDVEDVYLKLRQESFPSLKDILKKNRKLFEEVVLEELPSEFLGYVLSTGELLVGKKTYIVNSFLNIESLDDGFHCKFSGFITDTKKLLG
ncbi:hypothetical protein KIH87_12690 [Paraneptunicella aestuarii]|uniref:hypothetical protein n=1 Tax=Paraneptunicella aestuarii TaxID=2831148 RepID=UPI001E506475|nr:hypothetical protein [Paraneptunicella aestuarii]UAA37566.1 hypothetical protein KIH87_12690 [Paraneptunicella aestuarii]